MKKLLLATAFTLLFPALVLAHQPRLTEEVQTVVTDPEISKAYYGELEGSPHEYAISSDKDFTLYVNILTPDIQGQQKDISAVIIKDNDSENPLTTLNGTDFKWTQFFEPFGHDSYWKGPEFKIPAEPGDYKILVSSTNNNSKYSLAIGEIESFDLKETVNAITLIPKIKSDFFEESPAGFIFSPFGLGLIFVMFVLSFAFGFLYRLILKHLTKNAVRKVHKNIGKKDRLLRAAIGIILFVWAITTSWSPLLLFFSGFTFFEAIFSWCGFYAAIGRNSCPIN